MRWGFTSYAFAWSIQAEEWTHRRLVEEAAELGAEVLQICENLDPLALDRSEWQGLVRLARKRDLSLQVGGRGIDPATIHHLAERALDAGSDLVRLVLDEGPRKPSPKDAIAALEPVQRRLDAMGVRLAIENHDRFRAITWIDIADSVGCDVCLDTANSLGCLESPWETIELLAPLASNLHMKDVRIDRVPSNMGFVVSGTSLGEGMVEANAALRHVWKERPTAAALVELWPEKQESIEATVELERKMAASSAATALDWARELRE